MQPIDKMAQRVGDYIEEILENLPYLTDADILRIAKTTKEAFRKGVEDSLARTIPETPNDG